MRPWLLALLGSSLAVADFPRFFRGRPAGGFVDGGARRVHRLKYGEEPRDAPQDFPWVQTLNFTQQVDHFYPLNNTDTFKQLYRYNNKYVPAGGSNIIFLDIEGESPASIRWAGYEGYQYIQMAKNHSAHIFQLEHRCFGWSRPYNNLNADTLKLCTIEQALEDIATFIKAMNAQYNFVNPKWVTFGGSYPGILSALFRANYPSLTVGAVASSAPLRFTFDIWEYAWSMQATLSTIPGCADAVRQAFWQMQQLSLSPAGRDTLSDKLRLKPRFDNNTKQIDIDNFFENVFAAYQDIIQYTKDGRNDETKNGRDVDHLCQLMTNNNTELLERVWQVVIFANDWSSNVSLANSYLDMIYTLRDTSFDDTNGFEKASNRGWLWIQCAQMGVQQTTDQGDNIFGNTVPVNYFLYTCRDGFGISAGDQHAKTTAYRKKYGTTFKATNVVLPNGSFDPWHVTGLYTPDEENNIIPVLIDKGAHCSDMYEQYDGEAADLVRARKIISDAVARFLM